MANVRIWVGNAGSGKSSRIVDEIEQLTKEAPLGSPIYWVVPDDVAFAAEQMLLKQIPSVLRAEVITLRRLAERIRLQAGRTDETNINRAGKRLLLASAYAELRSELGPLARVQATSGFYDFLLDTFDEMTAYNVNLAAIEGALEVAAAKLEPSDRDGSRTGMGHALIGKLRDLCRLYIHYRTMLNERNFFDPALTLADAANSAPTIDDLKQAQLYFDGFYTLMPNQLSLMVSLSSVAHQTTFVQSVTNANPLLQESQPQSLLSPPSLRSEVIRFISMSEAAAAPSSALTLMGLVAQLSSLQIPFTVEQFSRPSESAPSAFAEIEAWFHSPHQQLTDVDEQNLLTDKNRYTGLRFFHAASRHSECREIAEDILRKMDQVVDRTPYRYRDFAIVVDDLQESGRQMSDVLSRYQQPHALDMSEVLATHPLGRFTIAFLQLILSDVSLDSVARLLRTDFCGLREEDALWLDMYIRTYHVEGRCVWLREEPWRFAAAKSAEGSLTRKEAEDARAERLRKQMMRHFGRFIETLSVEIVTPKMLAESIWALYEEVGVKTSVMEQIVRDDAGQNPLQASQDEQVWQQMIALLNDLASVHADAPFVREELFELVMDTLLTERQTMIPSGVDQIFITSYHNAHMWSKPHVYVMGMDHSSLPRLSTPASLLQDDERVLFEQLFGTPLAPTTDERMELDKEVAYRLLTRWTETLTLSYSQKSPQEETLPSRYFSRLQSAFHIPVDYVADEGDFHESVSGMAQPRLMSEEIALEYFVHELTRARDEGLVEDILLRPDMMEIGRHFSQTDKRVFLQQAVRGMYHELPEGRIPVDLAKRLYGMPLQTSVNRLETYAACPYRYYVRYGLGAQPLVFDTIEAVDVGNLLHDTVYDFLKQEQAGTVQLGEMTQEDIFELADKVYQDQLARGQHAGFQERQSRSVRADDLQTFVRTVAEILWLHAKWGAFRPHALEWSFGMEGDEVQALPISLPDGEQVYLRGRIDRLDIYEKDGVKWFRIFDYKTGTSNRLEVTKVYHGLQLQLLVYCAVVQAHFAVQGEARPAGVFYMPMVAQPSIEDVPAAANIAKQALYKLFRAEGYMHASDDAIHAMDERLAKGQASDMFPVIYKRDGSFTKTAKVWTDEEWNGVLAYTLEQVRTLAVSLQAGDISVRPFFMAHDVRGCTNCDFSAVCHFEPADHARNYRIVSRKTLGDIMVASEEEGQR